MYKTYIKYINIDNIYRYEDVLHIDIKNILHLTLNNDCTVLICFNSKYFIVYGRKQALWVPELPETQRKIVFEENIVFVLFNLYKVVKI